MNLKMSICLILKVQFVRKSDSPTHQILTVWDGGGPDPQSQNPSIRRAGNETQKSCSIQTGP